MAVGRAKSKGTRMLSAKPHHSIRTLMVFWGAPLHLPTQMTATPLRMVKSSRNGNPGYGPWGTERGRNMATDPLMVLYCRARLATYLGCYPLYS